MRKYTKLLGIIGFIVVETFFYFRSGRDNLELFFMIWIFISAVLMVNNTFRRGNRPAMIGLGANDSIKYAYLSSTFIEQDLNAQSNNKPPRRGVNIDSWNLVYLVFLVANIIGYIVVMPK